jgi:hypothetical protein
MVVSLLPIKSARIRRFVPAIDRASFAVTVKSTGLNTGLEGFQCQGISSIAIAPLSNVSSFDATGPADIDTLLSHDG